MEKINKFLYNKYVSMQAILNEDRCEEELNSEPIKILKAKAQEIYSVLYSCSEGKKTYKVTCTDYEVTTKKTRKLYVTTDNPYKAMDLAREIIRNHIHEITWRNGMKPENCDVDMLDAYDFNVEEIKPQEKAYPYYVTKYYLYAIHENAEGGYYYPGSGIDETRGFQNRKDAIRYINKLFKEHKYELLPDGWTFYHCDDNTHFGADGRYIGDGWFVVLERNLGSCVSGYVPYC